jgi:hypothetical protein
MGIHASPSPALIGLAAVVLLAACEQDAPTPAPPPPPSATPPAPAPALPSTTPLYPSIGNRLGDPHRIGPDDLHWAVDAAQSAVTGSRLISVQPAVWNVRLLTEGPSVKQVRVDAITRGAKDADLPAPPGDLAQTVLVENAIKSPWADAVNALQRQNPGSTVSSVVLDTSTLNPAWKITLLTGSRRTVYTVDATTGMVTGDAAGPRPNADYEPAH